MTVLHRGKNSYFLAAPAALVNDTHETASSWAAQHIVANDAIKWVVGKYVEADNANSNGQYWSLEDLRVAQPTINNTPMNMLHKPRNVVGAWLHNEMIYPTDEAAEEANPYIEVLGAFWKYYFPEELAVVEAAFEEGNLFLSMECVAETITFDNGEREETFEYKGPFHVDYGDWNKDSSAIRKLNQPTFLGGALIVPPVAPGWKRADVKDLSNLVKCHAALAEQTFEAVAASAPHMDDTQVEGVTLELLRLYAGENDGNTVVNTVVPNTLVEAKTAVKDSLGGGDMSQKTFTEDELNEAIAAALAPVKAELDSLKESAAADEVEKRIEKLEADHAEAIEALKTQVDTLTIERDAARSEFDAFKAELEAIAAKEAEAAEVAARTEERVAKVKEVASFSDEHVAANTARWAEMSDEAFESLLLDYAAAGSKPSTEKVEIPASTAMRAADRSEGSVFDDMRSVARLSRTTDIRKV